ncbi:hypothetical protein GCM10010965_29040 [Caldalkalibacillus thermarum]|uniref:RNA-guided endonuclease TnpB family protein n=1 Tax=Caldalkalibacillus thermarum TaxID=296745 RepID=UPI001668A9E2|nr:RNA-guided endonuclease TnpB family protein [Caldalkalibacillus thermarum]GGK34302.1 hypothetical protein GCM10010965_29040 [Caldalkalibacillus thermarum]
MKVVKTLRHKITSHSNIFDDTLQVYRQALTFVVEVMDREFPNLDGWNIKAMTQAMEKLIHATQKNPHPKYMDFDHLFYKFPSYFRRSAIAEAFGILKSHRSRYDKWLKEKEQAERAGRRFKKKPPKLQFCHRAFPVFYKGVMFQRTGDTTAKIKVFHQKDWVWITIRFKGQDLQKRGVVNWKENNPSLVKVGKKYFLHISYQKSVDLNNTPLSQQKICAVDLGLNQSAVCSIMDANGTVFARKFINQAKEKDRLYRMTNKLKKAQRQSGYIKAPRYWRRINGLQKQIVNHTAHEIVRFAQDHGADVIVFEYLDHMKMPKGFYGAKRLRFRLHYWRKQGIQQKVTEMAHCQGIRVARVNARNTSQLAFDGTGVVKRKGKKDVCQFSSGKIYHADLNATYNIGARYFLRELRKSTSEREWLSVEAKVPSLARRTQQTLASLISFHQAMCQIGA